MTDGLQEEAPFLVVVVVGRPWDWMAILLPLYATAAAAAWIDGAGIECASSSGALLSHTQAWKGLCRIAAAVAGGVFFPVSVIEGGSASEWWMR